MSNNEEIVKDEITEEVKVEEPTVETVVEETKVEDTVEEPKVEKTKEEIRAEKEERKRLREEERQRKLEEKMKKEAEINSSTDENIVAEEIPEDEVEQAQKDVEESQKAHAPHVTKHNFAAGEEVYVAEFRQVRDSNGYTMVVNNFRFVPMKGEIERVILTDKVQYKLKGKAGSLYDEEDVCFTEKEAQTLCDKKNSR